MTSGAKVSVRDHPRSGQQQADLRLFVDETVALGVIVGDRGQPRIEIAAHRLQDEPDVHPAERPRRLIQAGGLEPDRVAHDHPDAVGGAGREHRAGHEREAKLQQRRRPLRAPAATVTDAAGISILRRYHQEMPTVSAAAATSDGTTPSSRRK